MEQPMEYRFVEPDGTALTAWKPVTATYAGDRLLVARLLAGGQVDDITLRRGPERVQFRRADAPRPDELDLDGEDAGNVDALRPAHHHPDHATSVAAADRIALTAGTLRVNVLAALKTAAEGMTDVQIEEACGLRRPTGGNRRGELVGFGLVEERVVDGKPVVRVVEGHGPAKVWQITPRGRAALDKLLTQKRLKVSEL